MTRGLKPGTREWLVAMRAYHVADADVVALCDYLQGAWDKLDELESKEIRSEETDDEGTGSDDSSD